ncbi:MAG: hypothetical protein V2A55_02290 [Candidatus Jorgensenbacteria bacterium]
MFLWLINNEPFECGAETRTLMVQGASPPREYTPREPNTYTVVLMAYNEDRSVSDTDTRTLVVRRKSSLLVFAEGDWAGETSADIFSLALETGARQQLTTDGEFKAFPTLSHDGKQLAFVRYRLPCNGLLYVLNLDLGTETEIGAGATWDECGLKSVRAPRWSSDDKYIVVEGGYEPLPGVYRLSIVEVATRSVRRLDNIRTCVSRNVPAPCIDGSQLEVVWAPDGKSVYTTLWESLGGGKGQIHIVRIDVATLAVTRIYTDADNQSPNFLGPEVYGVSKDGTMLSIRSWPLTDDFRLAVLDIASGELRFVTPSQAGNVDWPVFCSVGGEERIFYVNKSRQTEFRHVRKDGTGDAVFGTEPRAIFTPYCWEPPGS